MCTCTQSISYSARLRMSSTPLQIWKSLTSTIEIHLLQFSSIDFLNAQLLYHSKPIRLFVKLKVQQIPFYYILAYPSSHLQYNASLSASVHSLCEFLKRHTALVF